MIDVEMTRDIREYEPKMFNLITLRQTILVIIGLAFAIPAAIFLPIDNLTFRLILATFCAAPFLACGWVNVYGMRLERFIWQMIKSSLFLPVTRKYKTTGSMDFLPAPTVKKSEEKKMIKRSRNFVGRK